MTDIVDRLRHAPDLWCDPTGQRDSTPAMQLAQDAAAEIACLRGRLADLEVSIAAFRQTVKDWEF